MTNITLKEWEKYRDLLSGLSQQAADEFRDAVFKKTGKFKGVGLANIPRDQLIDYAYALATKYGEGAAAVSCEFYDAIAALSGVTVPEAIPAPTATYAETAKAINGSLLQSESGQLLDSVVSRLVKQAGADTTLQNAGRDRAEFAWIPSGDTCAFCITLASRGWQRVSRKTLRNGHAEHIHANCDCEYAIRFNDEVNYKGYDPGKYQDMYYSQKGTPKQKINAMRREAYAENREKINAQKRSAYEKRKELNSSEAEEINVGG